MRLRSYSFRAIIFSTCLLSNIMVEGIACKRVDEMAEQRTAEPNATNALQRATEAMDKLDFKKARTVVFSILAEDLNEKTRFGIMNSFAQKFKLQALEEIRKEVILVGLRPESFSELEKKSPRRFGYMKTLAYGLALFGEKGFETAVDLIKSASRTRMPFFLGDQQSLLYGITTMAVYMLLNNNLIDKEKALQTLSQHIKDTGINLSERGIFIRWAIRIKPVAVCDLSKAMADDARTTELINLHLSNELKGKVPCAVSR